MVKTYDLFDAKFTALWVAPKGNWLGDNLFSQVCEIFLRTAKIINCAVRAGTVRQIRAVSPEELHQFLLRQQLVLSIALPLVENRVGSKLESETCLWFAVTKEGRVLGRINARRKIVLYPPENCPIIKDKWIGR